MKILKSFLLAIRNFYFTTSKKYPTRPRIKVGRIILTVLGLLTIAGLVYLTPAPRALSLNSGSVEAVPIDKEIRINFSYPVKTDEVVARITPDLPGKWSWTDGLFGTGKLQKTLVFKPIETYELNTKYVVEIKNVKRSIGLGAGRNFQLDFRTMKTPLVKAVIPPDQTGGVRADDKIVLELDSPNRNIVEYGVKFEPELAYASEYDSSLTSITLSPKTTLTQGQKYTMTVLRTPAVLDLETNKLVTKGEPEIAKVSTFTVATPPGIESFTPNGDHVLVNTREVAILFTQDMDRASVEQNFVAEPTLPGAITWEGDKKLIYKYTTDLGFSTPYHFVVKKGTKNKNGGFLTEDAIASFTTIGNAYVTYFSPANGNSGKSIGTTVEVGFDQAVDHSSAQSKFSLSGVTSGDFSWSGNVLRFKPSANLAKDSAYTISMSLGVESISGLASNRGFSAIFYTEESSVRLPIGQDFQDHNLSCELASLKMALNYKGANVGESDILSRITYNSAPRGGTWGNPYTEFVGSVDGSQNTTGYGVYWGPIASAGSTWRPTQAFTGWGAAQIAAEIAAGNPVVVWGTAGNASYDSWQTSSGQTIEAWRGEHVRLVIGYIGPVWNPRQFLVNDPIFGQRFWSASSLMNNMSAFGNAGVVVR